MTNDKCVFKISLPEAFNILDSNSEMLVGKILTLIEASALPDSRVESFKKIVKNYVWFQIKEMKDQMEKVSVKREIE